LLKYLKGKIALAENIVKNNKVISLYKNFLEDLQHVTMAFWLIVNHSLNENICLGVARCATNVKEMGIHYEVNIIQKRNILNRKGGFIIGWYLCKNP